MEKLFYGISEVSKMTKVPVSTLRFWESQVDKLKPSKSNGGTRRYDKDDIDMIENVKYLTEVCGYTLEGVNKRLNNRFNDVDMRVKLMKKLIGIRTELQEIRKELNEPTALQEEVIIEK
ncbi:MAG: MerR family transcriptional regulator [Paludibacteraceae bacterium]|nr:MerR family transcriptional regulator [Paludibacteraceae bacterium]